MKPDTSQLLLYSGTSMNPTLREPDLMDVRPYHGRTVRAGDVILFRAPGSPTPIVHRVERVTISGIRTRGDNCTRQDDWLLAAGDIIGQVTAAQRGERRRKVWNGYPGWGRAQALRAGMPICGAVNRILHIPYHALSNGAISRRLPRGLRPRKVLFQSGERRVWRMMWGRIVVGQHEEGRGPWRIRRPFRLLIDPRELDIEQ